MDIVKFKKLKDGFYNIELNDDKKITIHEDLILKYDLLIKKKISNKEENDILKENQLYLAYNKALKYLTTRMRSIKEIKNLLLKEEIDDLYIDTVIEKLKSQGYLNDIEYSKAYINDRINLSMDGPKKIISYLKKNDISDETIYDLISVFNRELEEERINKIISKSLKLNTNKGKKLLKQKIQNDLVNLGYSIDIIYECINNIEYDDEDLYKKEYDKLYKKLSSKYSGAELEYRIKQRLYQKGFNNN